MPKLKGGLQLGTVKLHQICHNAIHARYSEAEVARRLADVERLKAEPDPAAFIAGVGRSPTIPRTHVPDA